jgi:hypothetical protein
MVTIPIRLYCTLVTLPLSSLPLTLSQGWVIARNFLILFHIGIWSSSTVYYHLNILHSASPFPLVPHPPKDFTILFFVINIWIDVQRGVSMYAHCGYTLLWSVQSLPLLSLTPLPPTLHFSNAFNTYPCIFYLHNLCDITKDLSFSFPFPLSPSSIK